MTIYVRLANCNGSAFNFFDLIAFPPSVLGVISIKNEKLYTLADKCSKLHDYGTATVRSPHGSHTGAVRYLWGTEETAL